MSRRPPIRNKFRPPFFTRVLDLVKRQAKQYFLFGVDNPGAEEELENLFWDALKKVEKRINVLEYSPEIVDTYLEAISELNDDQPANSRLDREDLDDFFGVIDQPLDELFEDYLPDPQGIDPGPSVKTTSPDIDDLPQDKRWQLICSYLGEARKTELLELASQMGLQDHIKSSWPKARICETIRKLANLDPVDA